MFGLSFLAPLFLAGMATAAIPVVIHLMHRRRARTVPFSTLMFLRLSQQHVARRRRLRDLFLLLLRCLFLLLLAFAFAGPVLRSGRGGGNAVAHGALLVDDSYSMGYEHEGQTSFARLQEAANAIVEALPRQSEAALLFASGRDDLEVPELSPSLLQIRRTLGSTTPSDSAMPLAPALARAAAALSDATWPNRELYVLTDLQKAAWQGVASNATGAFAGVTVVVVDCGAARPENTAVTSLDTQQRTEGASREATISAGVQRFGNALPSVEVSLFTGAPEAQLRAVETVAVPASGGVQVSFSAPVEAQGILEGRVLAAPDALPADDARYFAVSGRGGVSVLLVGDAGAGASGATDLLYLQAALGVGTSPYATFAVTPADLTAMQLSEYPVIVTGQMSGVSPEAAAALRGFVQRGGGLALFVGPDMSAAEYNTMFGGPDASGERLLPVTLGDLVETPQDQRTGWDKVDETHPIFEVFAGAMSKELRFIRSQRHYAVQPVVGADASGMRVLVSYDDGQAAVVEGRCGAGRVVLFTTSCDGTWSNLPLRASFVPILHRTVAYLARQEATPADQRLVGQPIQFLFPGEAAPVSIEVTGPDGAPHVLESTLDGTHNAASFDQTGLAGLYRIKTSVPQSAVPSVVAVNVDVRESDLTRLPIEQIEALFPGADVRVSSSVERVGVETVQRHEGTKLWGPIIAFLAALGLVESLLASLFTPRRGPACVRTRSQDFVARRTKAPSSEVEP